MGRFERSDKRKPRGRDSGRSRDSFTKFEDRESRPRGRASGGSRDSFTRFEDRERPRGRSGGRDGRRGRDSGLEMHKVICDECGKSCEVPFKPTSTKPIYCSDCFKKGGRDGRSNGGGSSKVLDEINKKLDKIMESMGLN